jgi:transmembrane sensor
MHDMDQKTFEEFLKKVAQQTHSPSELAGFLAWLQTLPEEEAVAALDRYEQSFRAEEAVDPEALRRIEAGIEMRLDAAHPVHTIPPKRTPVVFYLKVAAVFVVVLSLVSFFLYRNRFKNSDNSPEKAMATIVPGKDQAVLKLSGGTSILLDEMADGVITMNDKATGFEKKNGLLVAKADGQSLNDANEINMLETPKGGQYQVALPDGTRVWLNASTRLFFPTVFMHQRACSFQLFLSQVKEK